jgi:hypothetical protein
LQNGRSRRRRALLCASFRDPHVQLGLVFENWLL